MTGWRGVLGLVIALLVGSGMTVAGIGAPNAVADGPHSEEFTNPILAAGADPSMSYYRGRFHLVQGDFYNNDNIVIRSADTLGGLGKADPIVVWEHPACPAPACTKIWAPELEHIGDRWWIYFAGQEDERNETHRMYALRSTGDDPTGPYEFLGKLDLPGGWGIDGVYQEYRNAGYFFWSCLRDPEDTRVQDICAIRMSDPMTPTGDRVSIATPTAGWETVPNDAGLLINEAPQPLLAPNGRLFMTFSANASFDDTYRLGLLELAQGADPMNPKSWTKSGGPILPGTSGAIAPGHNGFLSIDGHPWIAYHARLESGTGWAGRSIRVQPFTFAANGRPQFGMALGPDAPIVIDGRDPKPPESRPAAG
ncbi:glycoside hydrolase family 43 protein [Nocardia sp. CDC153]|uniref:glycoside hydrolase family 43 protein n=1 Tax=Nocardia sp. CDC153 TaxID=3112167 RepID=UPI002DB80B69|nr:glycoside hydrolase family 43 protein [Nocardia sp. CDC153]MEC3957108.1 glycoside hydrolase family 43 protein [Nocardia sp. CDC153]